MESQDPSDRSYWILWWLGSVLLLALAATVAILGWPGMSEGDRVLLPESRWVALVGLVGLVMVFILYATRQQQRFVRLKTQLWRAEIREETLRAHLTELSALFSTSSLLADKLDLKSMLEVAVQRLRPCLEADAAVILLRRPEQESLQAITGSSIGRKWKAGASVRLGEGVAGLVDSSGEPIIVNSEPMLSQLAAEAGIEGPIHSGVAVPIRMNRIALGVIHVVRSSAAEPYTEKHARMLEIFADHLAAAIARSARYRQAISGVVESAA